MIDKKGIRLLASVSAGAAIGALIAAFTPIWVQGIIAVLLSLSLLIDWERF